MLVENVPATSSTAIVKLSAAGGTKIARGTFRNVNSRATVPAISAIDEPAASATLPSTTLEDVVFENTSKITLNVSDGKDATIRNVHVSAPFSCTAVTLGTWESVEVDGVTVTGSPTDINLLTVLTGRTVRRLAVSNLQGAWGQANGARVLYWPAGATVNDLVASNFNVTCTGNTHVNVLETHGTISRFKMEGVTVEGCRSLLTFRAGASVPVGQVSNATLIGTNRLANFHGQASSDLTLTNVRLDMLANAAVRFDDTSNVILRGSGVTRVGGFDGWTNGGTGANTARVINPDFPTDLGLTGLTKAAGDMAFNTNTNFFCGAGAVISDGIGWRRMVQQSSSPSP